MCNDSHSRQILFAAQDHVDKLLEQCDAYRAQIEANDLKLIHLYSQLAERERVGNAIMLCATGKEAPLSDSDVCNVIEDLWQQIADRDREYARLRAQVEELRAQIEAVPMEDIRKLAHNAVNRRAWSHKRIIESWLRKIEGAA